MTSIAPAVIFTLGHSNRPVQGFLDLLRKSGVRQLADVRRYPFSKRHPEYNRENLEHILGVSWVAYRHYEDLGGFREPGSKSPHSALEPGLRGYADHTASAEFRRSVDDLLSWASRARTALLCAESDPFSCHRHLLSDYVTVHTAVRVVHIIDLETRLDHRLSALARIAGGKIIYDAGRLTLDFGGESAPDC